MTSQDRDEVRIVSLGKGLDAVVIALSDRFFNDYLGYTALLEEGLKSDHKQFVIDISDCEYISSNALGIMVYYHKLLRAKGGALIIVPPASAGVRAFALRCIGVGIPLADTVADALAILREESRLPEDIASRPRVLVVTPDRSVAGFLGVVVEYCGCVVTLAASAEEAVQKARSSIPDLAIVDACPPELDGINLCRVLKEIPEACDTALCILAAADDKATMTAARDAGCEDCIAKPVAMADCEQVIRHLLAGNTKNHTGHRRETEACSGIAPIAHRANCESQASPSGSGWRENR